MQEGIDIQMVTDSGRDPLVVKEGLEQNKRLALLNGMQALSSFAKVNINVATNFALDLLQDIREGNNPDLEPALRDKAEELDIDLDEAERVAKEAVRDVTAALRKRFPILF